MCVFCGLEQSARILEELQYDLDRSALAISSQPSTVGRTDQATLLRDAPRLVQMSASQLS